MRRILSLFALVLAFGLSTQSFDAEAAKRMGGGKSMGTQRQATQDKAPAATAAAPAAGAAAATPARSWMGPIAGLAAGLGLAALASHMGFGDELASMVMFGLLAAATMVAIGFFMRKRAAAKNPGIGQSAMQYAHAGAGTAGQAAPSYRTALPPVGGTSIGSAIGAAAGNARTIPEDFDAAAFERNAKVNFIRLQTAHDAGNWDDIRKFTTPEMYAELKQDAAGQAMPVEPGEVENLRAEVVAVDDDGDSYLVSVRFTGAMRTGQEADEPFDEYWQLMKARQGNSGWVLAGIQQAA